jgi:hypothetical protein
MRLNDCQLLQVASQIENLLISVSNFCKSLDKSIASWECQFKLKKGQNFKLQLNHLLPIVSVV